MEKRSIVWIFLCLSLGVLIFITNSCKKNETPPDPTPNPPPSYGTVSDIDGNVYLTLIIGSQEWMVQNLRTSRLNDGTAIPFVVNETAWGNLTTPGYCWYYANSDYKYPYGGLYNWATVNTGKLAPTGWRVPTEADWLKLINYLGGTDIAGGKMKEQGTSHWLAPNSDATNSSWFSDIPGGIRGFEGGFFLFGSNSFLWSSTESSFSEGWSVGCSYCLSLVSTGDLAKGDGCSVRCVKN